MFVTCIDFVVLRQSEQPLLALHRNEMPDVCLQQVFDSRARKFSMAHTPSGQDAVPEAPTSSRPSAQTGDYLAANRNVDSHALSPVMASPAWNTQSPLHYGPETSSGRSGSFNFPSPAPQNNSPAIISGLQQVNNQGDLCVAGAGNSSTLPNSHRILCVCRSND